MVVDCYKRVVSRSIDKSIKQKVILYCNHNTRTVLRPRRGWQLAVLFTVTVLLLLMMQ